MLNCCLSVLGCVRDWARACICVRACMCEYEKNLVHDCVPALCVCTCERACACKSVRVRTSKRAYLCVFVFRVISYRISLFFVWLKFQRLLLWV